MTILQWANDDGMLSQLGQGNGLGFAAALVAGILLVNHFKKEDSNQRKMKRSWSFTSEALKIGSFPPEKNVPNPIINCALLFKDCPSEKDVAETVVKPMLEYERLSKAPERDDEVAFAPLDLVRTVTVDGDDTMTIKALSTHLEDDLRNGRGDLPWWEFLIARNKGSGVSAVMLRMEHCLADGLSLVHVFEQILTYKDGSPLKPLVVSKMKKHKRNKPNPLYQTWSVLKEVFHVLTLAMTPYDSRTAFSRSNSQDMKYSGNRTVVIFPTIGVDFCKKLKNAAGCTINDVLLCTMSQAIRDYCSSQNCPVIGPDAQCRALMPVSLPRSSDEMSNKSTALGNRWCMVSAPMHVNEDDIMDRLKKIQGTTTEMKSSPRAYVQLSVQNELAVRLPVFVGQKTVFDTFSRHSLVLTNVMGPDQTVLFAGKAAVGVQMLFTNLISQASFLSYGGEIFGNITVDPDAIQNSQNLAIFYARAFCSLAERLHTDAPTAIKDFASRPINGARS